MASHQREDRSFWFTSGPKIQRHRDLHSCICMPSLILNGNDYTIVEGYCSLLSERSREKGPEVKGDNDQRGKWGEVVLVGIVMQDLSAARYAVLENFWICYSHHCHRHGWRIRSSTPYSTPFPQPSPDPRTPPQSPTTSQIPHPV